MKKEFKIPQRKPLMIDMGRIEEILQEIDLTGEPPQDEHVRQYYFIKKRGLLYNDLSYLIRFCIDIITKNWKII